MTTFEFNKDVIIHRRGNTWTLMNVRAFTHVEIDLSDLAQLEQSILTGKAPKNSLTATDKTYFSNLYCLMGDPTRFMDEDFQQYNAENSSQVSVDNFKPEEKIYKGLDDILELLKKRMIITEETYQNYFGPKESLFDKHHAGTFHQQVGLELLGQLRTTSDKWWPTQKFSPSGELLNNPYKFIQFNFFKQFFTQEKLQNKKVLDLGCGTGFYSKHFLEQGASVCGIDPNPEYISLAQKECKKYPQAHFTVGIVEEGNDSLQEEELFDIIYISDMFLFYTKGLAPGQTPQPQKLLNAIKKHLKPTGYIYLTEPHGVFWQTPWLGKEDLPYTVISEYLNKKYGVTPTLSEITSYFSEAELSVLNIFEPTPDSTCIKDYSPRAGAFASEFPLWWTFLLTHKPTVDL